MDLTTLALLALTPLLVWRVYSRLKSNMQRQRSILSRHYTGLMVFIAVVVVPAAGLMKSLPQLGALLAGAVAGIALGVYGLRVTRFEDTEQGYYFTPNARLGILVAMVLIARILYLGVLIYVNKGSNLPNPRFTDSPLTLWCLGLTAGYFGTYSAGLVRWRHQLRKAIRKI